MNASNIIFLFFPILGHKKPCVNEPIESNYAYGVVYLAATHLVPNPFGPRTSGPPLPVPMDKWSPKIRSPWTNGPQPIWSPWTNGPHQIWSPWTNGPQPIWSPYFQIITACPPGQTEYSRDHLSRGTKLVGDHLSRGTKFLGTICPGGPNLMGTVCPGGPNGLGTICPWGPNFWVPFVHGDKKWGTRSPGIKWVRNQMSRSRKKIFKNNLIALSQGN